MPQANSGTVIVLPTPGVRRFNDFAADVRGGELHELVHKDLTDREIAASCEECGEHSAEVRCDFRLKDGSGRHCGKLLCRASEEKDSRGKSRRNGCAVRILSLPDFDLCVQHARELGVIFDLNDEARAREIERIGARPQGYRVAITRPL